MRALLLSYVVLGVGLHAAVAIADPPDDPPPPDPGNAVAPDAPPLAPMPAPSPTTPAPAPPPAPQWGMVLPLVDLEPYPEAFVDRPITLLPGMTQVGVGYAFSSTPLEALSNHTPDIGVRHAFDAFEIAASLGQLASLSAAIPTGGFPAVIKFGAESGAPQEDNSLHLGQFVDVEHKVHVAPGQCALFFAIGASYNENRLVDDAYQLVWTHVLVGSGDAELEVQLLPTLSLDVGFSFEWAAESSQQLDRTFYLTGSATFTATFAHTWDVYASGALGDLADTRLPYLAFGFDKRWGG